MFGIGKEQSVITSGERVIKVLRPQEAREELTTPEMPDAILPVLERANQSFEEYQQLISIKRSRRLPRGQRRVYRDRIRQIEAELEGASKIVSVIEKGYEPYTVPEDFYAGLIETRRPWQDPNGIWLQFNAPMPSEILDKYETARKSKLFDTFLVASPDRDLFRSISPITVEPFLVGFVKTTPQGVSFSTNPFKEYKFQAFGGVGFLIAHWDLEKDLQFNPQN